ncbi:hypothetical protein EON65_41985 [archaeon]|nr:MAG: hypothetical protein EON65_41985 [archaeon]
MDKAIFNLMLRKTEQLITNKFKLTKSNVILVSGGSAWADHIAVRLWLESMSYCNNTDNYAGLHLFLPCSFDSSDSSLKFRGSAGETLNRLHAEFTQIMKTEFDSQADMFCALALGAEVDCNFPGFLNRNLQVAKSEYVIAYTWGESSTAPKDGGTKYTWNHCVTRNKVHVPLSSLRMNNTILSAYSSNTHQRDHEGIGQKRKGVSL